MSVTPGTRLGPYEVVAPLGAGGMGEVHRARDTRLGRDVAVKVLPQHLSTSPEIRTRFEREAKTVSGLNHPNICTLHDVGREGTIDYLVMELIEGDTLATRIKKGPLPKSRTHCASVQRSPMRWTARIAPVSCTAISSPATSCSPRAAPTRERRTEAKLSSAT